MHRVWTILKVVQQIAHYVAENGDLHSMMLTSRMCFDTAAPLLWRSLGAREVEELLKILYVDWEVNGNSILPSSFGRFTLYVAFARAINIDSHCLACHNDKSNIKKFDSPRHLRLAIDLFSSNMEYWFPNLQSLQVSLTCPDSLETLFVATQFIVPSLRKVELFISIWEETESDETCIPFAVDGLLRRMCRTVKHLGSLSFTGHPYERCWVPVLTTLIPTNPLTYLCITSVMLSQSMAAAISSSDVKTLELDTFDQGLVEPPLLSSFLSFPRLRSLAITGVPPVLLNLLEFLVAGLHHITISMNSRCAHPIESVH